MQVVLKVLISVLVIVGASELSKRNTMLAALFISLPLVSILTFTWIHLEGGSVEKITSISHDILLFGTAPSFCFFLLLPYLLKHGVDFFISLLASCIVMSAAYWLMVFIKKSYLGS
jgi:hypothetical protein